MVDHPDAQRVMAVLEALSDPEARGVLTHLLSCPACARWALDVLQGSPKPADWSNVLHFGITSAFDEVWGRHFAEAEAERRESSALLEQLLGLPAAERESRVRHDDRFRTWALADEALGTASSLLILDPARGRDQIELGLTIAETLDAERYGDRLLADLEARGRSLLGEAHRRLGSFREAEGAFRRAERALERSIDPAETARFEHLLGLLRRDQERLTEARNHLEQAVATYLEVGDREGSARPLASLGLTDLFTGRLDEAESRFRQALDRLGAGSDSLTRLVVCHHLALSLLELERFPEAQKICTEAVSLLSDWPELQGDPRVSWLRGILALGTGDPNQAIALLERACEALRTQTPKRSFVLASLDLAVLYLERDRADGLEQIVREIQTCPEAPRLTGSARTAVEFLKGLGGAAGRSRDETREARLRARPARVGALSLGDPV